VERLPWSLVHFKHTLGIIIKTNKKLASFGKKSSQSEVTAESYLKIPPPHQQKTLLRLSSENQLQDTQLLVTEQHGPG
jgi:hypothetical protein